MENDVKAAVAEFVGKSEADTVGGSTDDTPRRGGGFQVAGNGGGAEVGVGVEG